MAELMLINPRRRKRKMTAKQKKYFGKRRKRAAPARAVAPRRRRRRAAAKSVSVKRIYAKRRRRGRPRKASGLSLRSFTPRGFIGQVMPAAIGAAGALAFDVAYAMAPIPVTWKAGPLAPLTKVAAIIGGGMLAGMIAPKKLVNDAVAGALLVTAYDFIKGQLRTMAPNLPLSEYVSGVGYISPAITYQGGVGEYMSGMTDGQPSYYSTAFDSDEIF